MLSNVSRTENAGTSSHLDKITSNSSLMKNMVLASKGDTSYMRVIDLDEDGIITMDEFNEYCTKNGVSDADKQKLFMIMQMAKSAQKLAENNSVPKENKEDKEGQIYARLGDEKYDEKMDENHDSRVTYEEYMKYCNQHLENSDNQKVKDKINEAYEKKEEIEHKISVEIEA